MAYVLACRELGAVTGLGVSGNDLLGVGPGVEDLE